MKKSCKVLLVGFFGISFSSSVLAVSIEGKWAGINLQDDTSRQQSTYFPVELDFNTNTVTGEMCSNVGQLTNSDSETLTIDLPSCGEMILNCQLTGNTPNGDDLDILLCEGTTTAYSDNRVIGTTFWLKKVDGELDNIGTVSLDLDIHVPSLNYQTLSGSQNIWVDFQFFGQNDNGELLWKLEDYGINQ